MAREMAHVVPAHYNFTVHVAHNCVGVFYVTDECIVRCEAQFYDLCLYTPQQCSEIVFTKDTCAAGRLPFNQFASVVDASVQHDNSLFYSINSVTKRTGGTTKHQRQHHAQCCNGYQTHSMQYGAHPVVWIHLLRAFRLEVLY